MPEDPIARRLAEIAARSAHETLPEPILARAARILVDTLAGAIAGAADPFCRRYLATVGVSAGAGQASTIASQRGVPAETAAFANALPTTVLQIDEGHRLSGSHPGIHVVPAALAVAEERHVDGAQLLGAIVAGYDVAGRIGLALRPLPPDMHPNGTAGTFGAAIAAAVLWGADGAHLARVIDAVASIPLRPRITAAFDGSSVLHLYAALGAQTGVTLARAVDCGATCVEGAFDAYYLAAFSGGGEAWDLPGFEVDRSYFKYYPACAHAHTSIEALETLLASHEVRPEEVARIDVHGYAAATALRNPRPTSDLAARFSLPFCLARRLVAGPLEAAVFGRSDLGDPATLALAERVHLEVDPILDRGYPAGRPVRVSVQLTDGTTLVAECRTPRGDCERPEPEAAWRSKIVDLVGLERATALLAFVDAPASTWAAGDVGAVIRGAAGHTG